MTVFIAAIMSVLAAFAADGFSDFSSRMSSLTSAKCVVAEGTVTIRSTGESSVSDMEAVADNRRYMLKTESGIYASDGEFTYVVDDARKEVTVSVCDGASVSAVSNPIGLLTGIGRIFSVTSSSVKGGEEVYGLRPVSSGTGITDAVLVLKNGVPVSIRASLDVLGARVEMEVIFSSFRISDAPKSSVYTIDLAAYEARSYFINDLR